MPAPPQYRAHTVLWLALALNAGMFAVEFVYSQLGHSAALLADSADMFGDALVYALTLWVLNRTARWRGFAVLIKAAAQAAFAAVLLVLLWRRATDPVQPDAAAIGWVALAALGANLTCATLLLCHREDGANMRSVWLCSRNDAIANIAMIAAAWLVAWTGSRWPDLLLGGAVAALFLNTSVQLLPEALREWRRRGHIEGSANEASATLRG